jgi:hypothetical protein
MKELSIDLEDLVIAMTRSDDEPLLVYLDVETGEIVHAWPDEDEKLESSDRHHPVPRIATHEQYDWRAEFARSVDEDDIREMFDLALQGKGAFGRFRGVLVRYPDIDQRWTAFERARVREEATAWLRREGITAVITEREIVRDEPVKAAPVVTLYDLLLLGAPDGTTERIDGQVSRRLVTGTSSNARAAFKQVAREISEREGVAWRKRFLEGGASRFDLGRFHLRHEDVVVELRVDVTPETWRTFRRP